MGFSIIIVNFNTKDLLKNCLLSILSLRHDFEVIVVDNNSQDGSVAMLQNEFADKIKLIVNDKNIGFGPANNQAAKLAQGRYLFFLNSDTLAQNDIFTPLAGFLNQHQEVGIVAPQLLLTDGAPQLYAYGKFPSIFNSIFKRFNKIKDNNNDKSSEILTRKKNLMSYELIRNGYLTADWVSGAALIIRRELFEKIGGFDEKYFMYFEDVDLCQRVKGAGYKVVVSKKDALIHLCGKSLTQNSKRKKYYYQSQNYFFRKHYGRTHELLLRLLRLPYKFFQFFRQS